jgi:hypothetical protein
MEIAYRERWEPEIAEMRRVLAGLAMKRAATHTLLDDPAGRPEVTVKPY